jgi:hypothetical protein
MNGDDVLLAALRWCACGASVVPLRYRTKYPDPVALRSTGHTIDGRPSWGPLQRRPPTWAGVATWFRPDRRLNLGVVTGYGGIICIDFDSFGMFGVWCDWAQAKGGLAAEVAASTYKVLTRRGVHLWLKIAEPVASAKGPGFDIKAAGGYALVPPSIHPSGVRYTAFADAAPIIECQRLADVFPFVPANPAKAAPVTTAPRSAPAMSAGRVRTGGGGIDRIKARLDIVDVLRGAGVDVPAFGGQRRVKVCCPLHDDREPSAVVDTDGRFFCYAGCTRGKSYDAIDLYGALYGLDFRDVLGKLARELNIDGL